MDVSITIWGLVVALTLFTAVGVAMFVIALRPTARNRDGAPSGGSAAPAGEAGFGGAMRRYVGPVSPDLALLTAPRRVLLEFVSALCGFPGFGWLASTRVSIGLPLLCIAPAIIYGGYPVYLAMTGHLLDSPYVAIQYLPAVALVSASCLAFAEFRARRSQ